jgi:hypothetical protein
MRRPKGLTVYSDTPWSDAAASRLKRDPVRKRPSNSPKVKRKSSVKSKMPANASLSPCGDLGALGGEEAYKIFPALTHMGSTIVHASDYFPGGPR